MKIAVATEEGKTISSHFGRCPYFAIFDVHDQIVTERSMRPNTFTRHLHGERHREGEHHHGDPHAHQSVADGLSDCAVVISHGMGRRAWEDLRARGIEMIVTDETDAEEAVRMYLAGELKDQVEKLH